MGTCNSTNNKQKQKTGNEPQEPVTSKSVPPTQPQPEEPKPEPVEIIKKLRIVVKQLGQVLLESEFEETTTLQDVYNKLTLQPNWDYDVYDDKAEKVLNDKLSSPLKDIFPDQNQDIPIELSVKYSGLSVPGNCRAAYAEKNKLIGTLILDNPERVGAVVYDTSTSKVASYYYSLEESAELKDFGSFSAFCNACDKIYLSGGEIQTGPNSTEKLSAFYEIDLNTLSKSSLSCTKLPDLIEARTWHSMIFVPDQYIFIVGGIGTKSVEVYDIVKGQVEKDSELNEARSECTLCLINDSYLYAFCGFLLHQTYITSIERCYLRKSKRTWETVNYTLDNNITFNPSFFAVAYFKNDIILLGGNENSEERNKNYIYQTGEKDTLVEYGYRVGYTSVYREKFFIPINQQNSVLLPLVSSDIEVFLFNEDEGKITKTQFKEEKNEVEN